MKVRVINPDCLAHSDPRYKCCTVTKDDICVAKEYFGGAGAWPLEVFVPNNQEHFHDFTCHMQYKDVEIVKDGDNND